MALAALFLAGTALYAQNAVPGQLGTEIQTLEQRLSHAGISPTERHDVLVRLAQLRQLSGNIAGAAANWLDAAAADPNDDAALAAGAYCLAAIGEWEKAALILLPLLASDRWGPAMLQAQFLDASLKAWSAKDTSSLAALAERPEFAAMHPIIYYTLWQTLTRNPVVSGTDNIGTNAAESWKSRLLTEFPQSPEARAINFDKQKELSAVSTVQSPLWLLFPGAIDSPTVATAKPAAPAASAVSAPATPAASVASSIVLQTGLFSKEANARAQSEALRKAGFTAYISRKLVNGAEHWAVTVPSAQDQRKTIADLKKAGFDSFPVKIN